jgi:plastocyanin
MARRHQRSERQSSIRLIQRGKWDLRWQGGVILRTATPPNIRSVPPLQIVDQNGQLALSGAPSATSTIVDVTVGPDFAFHPDTVNISVGDTVRWTWDGSGHSVTSGPPCAADSQFCSPNDMNCFPGVLSNEGTVYQHTFANAGTYSYFCLSHCLVGMTGVVNVSVVARHRDGRQGRTCLARGPGW